jgi:hypothetical protein
LDAETQAFLQHSGSDGAMAETYSSASGGSLSSQYFSADESAPLIPPTETPPDNAKIFGKNVMKKFGIVAGMVIAGGIIAGIVGSKIKHHEHRDFPDSGYVFASSIPSSRHFDNLSQKRSDL